MRRSTRRGYREILEGDLEIMPLMNLFVALIPMLLISAVFLNVTVIDMKLPTDASAAEASVDTKKALQLAVTIRDEHYVVEGRSMRTQAVSRDDEDAEDQLTVILDAIKAKHPDNEDIIIISEPTTRYEDIIGVMDICRDSGMGAVSLLGSGDGGEV